MSFFKYKNTEMYYESYGHKNPILMIHGWGIDHNYFIGAMEPIFQQLGEEYQRYYIDLPGMGLSKPGFVQNGDDIMEVIIAFIKQVIQSESVLLVGNSFGGLLSCGIARKVPELVRGMILIAPSTGCENRNLPKQVNYKIDEEFVKKLTNGEREDFCAFDAVLNQKSWEQYEKFIYPSVLQSINNDFLNHVLHGTIGYDLFEIDENQQFVKPVLLLVGKQDTSVGFEDQFELMKQYPNSTYVALPDAGHNLWVDQQEEFHEIVYNWMRKNG